MDIKTWFKCLYNISIQNVSLKGNAYIETYAKLTNNVYYDRPNLFASYVNNVKPFKSQVLTIPLFKKPSSQHSF